MSKIEKLLGARYDARRNQIFVETINPGDHIVFLGSTMATSLSPRQMVDSFTINKSEGESTGMVALQIGRKGTTILAGFVGVDWTKEYPIDLDQQWIPPIDRVGHVSNSYIEVRGRLAIYTTCSVAADQYKLWADNPRYVPDADLLCRFLFGTAQEKELQEMANKYRQEKIVEDMLAEAQAGLLKLAGEIDTVRREKNDAEGEIALLKQERAHDEAIAALNKQFLKDLADRVNLSRWGIQKDLKRMLKERMTGAFRIHRQYRKEGE